MHGRLKVKTSAEQQEQKRKEREKKLKLFQKASAVALEKIEGKVYDQDGLDVTQQLLSANSDYSSMWNYRKDVINFMSAKPEEEIQKLLDDELAFLAFCLRNNPKSYGCWHHRCFTMLKMPTPDWKKELDLCNQFLQFDERNFHCWDYRRFVVNNSVPTVSVDDEIKCTDKLVASNFSNYSSWHYRSKLLPIRYPCEHSPDRIEESKLLEELELVQNAFFTDPNDQSAWFYHRWLLGKTQAPQGLIAVHCSKTPLSVTCIFRKPINREQLDACLSVAVNDTVQRASWRSSVNGPYQHSWRLESSQSFSKINTSIAVTYMAHTVKLDLGEHCLEKFWDGDSNEAFQQQISNAKLDVLQAELESCIQLNDLEPGNKWALLTLVLLMRAVNPLKHASEIEKHIVDLKSIDTIRKKYYDDMHSKFAIEDMITGRSLTEERHTNLSGKGLTRLCHLQYFSTVCHLDISRNHLTKLAGPFHLLQCCVTVIAEDNMICDISGIRHLPSLTMLVLNGNRLKYTADLKGLLTCDKLRELGLSDNEFSTDDTSAIFQLFDNVDIKL